MPFGMTQPGIVQPPMSQIQPWAVSSNAPSLMQAQPIQGGGLINTASNYGYPLTSGLMGAMQPPQSGGTALGNQGGTDWTQVALQMAGNPHAGPYAPVSVPNAAMGAPGAPGSGGGGSFGSTLGGLLTAAAQNPNIVKQLGQAAGNIGKLFGSGSALPTTGSGTYGTGGTALNYTTDQYGVPTGLTSGNTGGGLLSYSTDQYGVPTNFTDPSSTYNPYTDPNGTGAFSDSSLFDTSGTGPSFSPAGGEAANTGLSDSGSSGGGLSFSGALGDANSALSIYNGLKSGTATGDIGAGLAAANLAKNTGLIAPSTGVGGGLGAAGGLLSMYNGLHQGGVVGDTQAALGAAQTYAGASALDTAAGGTGLAGGSAIGAYAGPIGLALAPALYGMSQPTVQENSTWYNNFGNNVGAGLGPNATVQQKLLAATTLQQLGLDGINSGPAIGIGSSGTGVNMGRLMQTLAPYGITSFAQAQQIANQLINSIPAGAMPGQGVNQFGTTTVGRGNTLGLVHVA